MTILDYLEYHVDPALLKDGLPFATEFVSGEAGSFLCREGEVEDKVYFLSEGLIQVSLETARGDERILDFFFPGSFFCSYSSLLSGNPSDVDLVALTDFRAEYVLKNDLLQSYKTSLLANILGRLETEKLYLRKVRREKDLLTKTAEERYLELLAAQSPLLHLLTIDKLAKYLGIHPESLSRIRRKRIADLT